MPDSRIHALFSDTFLSGFLVIIFGLTGFINYLRRRKFSVVMFVADFFTSLTCGFVSYLVATGQGYPDELCLGLAFLVSHNGTRMLFLFDKFLEQKTEKIIDKLDQ